MTKISPDLAIFGITTLLLVGYVSASAAHTTQPAIGSVTTNQSGSSAAQQVQITDVPATTDPAGTSTAPVPAATPAEATGASVTAPKALAAPVIRTRSERGERSEQGDD